LCNKVHKGNLIFSSVPLIFTNYGILKEPNDKIVSNIVSFLDGDVHWTHFYELGRMESDSPFRYILSQPPLKWALYTILISIVLFMGFKIKREQRVIPVIEPLINTTLVFVKTISRLYFVQKDHRDLALKKALYFTEFIREHLYIDTNEDIDAISEKVSRRANINKDHIRRHFLEIQRITDTRSISASELQSFAEQTDIIVNKISNYKI
jgi:hypothetical protein